MSDATLPGRDQGAVVGGPAVRGRGSQVAAAGNSGDEPAFCTRCGLAPEAADHATCARWLASEEPPRFCAQCARRMRVQIIPTGWSAECSRHGAISGGAGV